jgi:ABC-type multidrug transport system ATPase subunit
VSEVISARAISKSYGDRKAVDGLDLKVESGAFFGFLGPNGAGKTTTIRMLTGVLRPDSGTVTIDGHDSHDRQHIARAIGVVSESRGFYDWMSGEEYLDFFAALYGIGDRGRTVRQLLADVGLADRGGTAIGTYSRGMKQRLGLARALVNSPRVLFLDEPTLGLDPQGQEDVQQLLKRLNEGGVTVFYSSHLLHEVAHLCSVIAVINRGRLAAEGTIAELQRKTGSEDLRDIFMALTSD